MLLSDAGSATRVGPYVLLDVLGSGAFGVVRYAVDERSGMYYAIKVLRKADIEAHDLTVQVRREVAVLRAVKHPHVVNLHDVLVSPSNIYLVLEYVSGGELFDRIARSSLGHLDEHMARTYFSQLASAVAYLHARRVYHRDLKPENVLISEDGLHLKLTDFGFASIKRVGAQHELLRTVMGSPHYLPPEVVRGAELYDGAKADSWACGIILFAMLAGHLPFDDEVDERLYDKVINDPIEYPAYFSLPVRQVLEALLDKDPDRRATMNQVKNMRWMVEKHETTDAVAAPTPLVMKRKSRKRGKRERNLAPEIPGDVISVRNVHDDRSGGGPMARCEPLPLLGVSSGSTTGPSGSSVLVPLQNAARRSLARLWLPNSTSTYATSDTSDETAASKSGNHRSMKLLARRTRAIRPRRHTTPMVLTSVTNKEHPDDVVAQVALDGRARKTSKVAVIPTQRRISPLHYRSRDNVSSIASMTLPQTSVPLSPPLPPPLPKIHAPIALCFKVPVDPAIAVPLTDDDAVEAALIPTSGNVPPSPLNSVIFRVSQLSVRSHTDTAHDLPGRPPHPLCPAFPRSRVDRPVWAVDNDAIFADFDARKARANKSHVFAPLAESWTKALHRTPAELPLEKVRSML